MVSSLDSTLVTADDKNEPHRDDEDLLGVAMTGPSSLASSLVESKSFPFQIGLVTCCAELQQAEDDGAERKLKDGVAEIIQ